jgi:hypothetical protein
MADASAVTSSTGLGGDNTFLQVLAVINKLIGTDIPALRYREANRAVSVGTSLGGGTVSDTTNGGFRSIGALAFLVNGQLYNKAGSAATVIWDLSAEAAVGASSFRGYRLMLTSGGTASFTAGADTSSVAAALNSIDALTIDTTKAVIADFVAGPSTSFSSQSLSGVSGAVLYQGFGQVWPLASYKVYWA